MGSNKITCFSLLLMTLPLSYCYDDSVTLTLIERMETLEQRDKEKTLIIERVTKQLSLQEEKIKVLELTIEDLMENVPKHSNSQPGKAGGTITKLRYNQSKLLKKNKTDFSEFASYRSRNIILHSDGVIRNQSGHLEFHVHKTQGRKWATKAKNMRWERTARKDRNGHHVTQEIVKNNEENTTQNKMNRHKKRFVSTLEGPIAFHAVSNKGEVSHLGTNENIKFETVLLNAGGGFHSQHGLFIAPKAGIYLFSSSVLTAGTMVYAEITKNGAVLAKVYGHGQRSVIETQGSVTIVTQMNVGDEVWIKHSYPADGAFWGEGFTSFTGVLIANI